MFPRSPAVSKRVLHDDSHDEDIVDFHLFLEDSQHERAGQWHTPRSLFTPYRTVGALLGAVVGHGWSWSWPMTPRLFAVLGAAATMRAHFPPWS
jgi:hypothetical protein